MAVRTNPIGVKVFIDGVERGTTPVSFETMQHGDYSVRLSKEGFKDRVFNVTLFSTSRLVISIKMEEERGFVQVSVQKTGEDIENILFNPQIFISSTADAGVPIYHENNALLSLPTGYHTIRARAFGWEDTSVTVLVKENDTVRADIFMSPAQFNMKNVTQSRRRFNPLNPGSLGENNYSFEVTSPGDGTITITNSDNDIVFFGYIEIFKTWINHITWDGRDSEGNLLSAGTYTVLIKCSRADKKKLRLTAMEIPFIDNDTEEIFSFTLETGIYYSTDIFPLSLESGIAGLTFAPMPHVLPSGSYQLDAGIFFGNFYLQEKNSFALPVEINMRISPYNRLELTAFVNIIPYFGNKTQKTSAGWGIAGSIKYNIIESGSIPLAFAAGVSYAWAGKSGELPQSPGRGVGIHLPLSLELTNFSIIFSPSVFWHGPENPAPLLLLSTGVLYKGAKINAGLSARCEMNFTEKPFNPGFLTGAEVSLLPSSSNLFFSFLAGVIYQQQRVGWYSGFKIGIIN